MMSIHLIHASAGTPWHLDSKFWVAIPVVLFLALVIYKGALKALSASLDARSDAIRSELDEARDAENMAVQARKDLSERLERRAAQAEAKIANAEAQAMGEVKAKAADLALDTAETLLRTKLTAADKSKLIQEGIKQMGATLG